MICTTLDLWSETAERLVPNDYAHLVVVLCVVQGKHRGHWISWRMQLASK